MAKEQAEISPAGFKVFKNSTVPLYLQVYEQFREMILSQRLRAGDRLPASRNFAKELGVSRVIVSQGYEQLIMEGYVVGKPGAGTFVADSLPDQLLHTSSNLSAKVNPPKTKGASLKNTSSSFDSGQKQEIRPFQGGTPSLDFFPYKIWQQIGNQSLKNLKSFHLGYDDTLGYWPLRQEIAAYLRMSRAVKCEANQIIVVTGSQQGLNLIASCLLQKDDKVWLEDPGYPGALRAFANVQASLCPIPIEDDGLNLAYAIKYFGEAKLAYLTPSHQFPLGCTLSENKRLQLLEWAHQSGMWIIEDDYDSEFRYEGRPLTSLQGLDEQGVVIYSGTFSKVLFPGLRLAYLVLPTIEMVEQFRKIKYIIDRQSPILEQIMVTKFMEEGHFLRHIRKMRLLYAERQGILLKLLQQQLGEYLQVSASPSGMHLLCRLSDQINYGKLREEIKKQGLLVNYLDDFTLQRNLPHALILGYTAFSNYKLKNGVEQLRKCIHLSLD
jgi:GntR family transcriptional regulator/MocR family aminotransferase